jgi:hypothetical protein
MMMVGGRNVRSVLAGAIAMLGLGLSMILPTLGATLDESRRSDFFKWFHLEPSCTPASAESGRAWHCFRPSGPAFRPLVELDLLVTAPGEIATAVLGIDRAFIDGDQALFAADIAKSFLGWAVPLSARGRMQRLIANIADPAAYGGNVLVGRNYRKPPPDDTGGYEVFRGRADAKAIDAPGVAVSLVNVAGKLPAQLYGAPAQAAPDASAGPRWLRIEVRPAGGGK